MKILLMMVAGVVVGSDFRSLLEQHRFAELVSAIDSNSIEVSDEDKKLFERTKADISRQMNTISVLLSSRKKQQAIAPIFKWGQSLGDVFLHLKLSHRFDAPGCLEVSSISAESSEGRLKFRSECVMASSPLSFSLDFALFKAAKNVELQKESVGTYTLIISKETPEIWPDIFADFAERNGYKSRIWFELEDKYPKDMEEFLSAHEKYIDEKNKEAKNAAKNEKIEKAAKEAASSEPIKPEKTEEPEKSSDL